MILRNFENIVLKWEGGWLLIKSGGSIFSKDFSAQKPSFLVSIASIDLAWHVKTIMVHNNV